MPLTAEHIIEAIRELHADIRDRVVAECESSEVDKVSAIASDGEGDTIYAIDRISEERVVEFMEFRIACHSPVVLIAEGIEGGSVVLPRGVDERAAEWRIIVDPIDGTRGLMYQKRSGWVLTGVAPNRGQTTSLRDIVAAVQTEIPLIKQHLSDSAWAVKGAGVRSERFDRLTGRSTPVTLSPSKATSIAHGFATMSRFFAGVDTGFVEVFENVVTAALGPVTAGKASCFEDQYISTGGQLYELMAGHDRFVADLRPLSAVSDAAMPIGRAICCHPYDLCTELIARELGVIVEGVDGYVLDAPLDVEADVAWLGYANLQIKDQLHAALIRELDLRGFR